MQPGTPNLAPGTLIGGEFRIVGPLSAGGMGAVYVAEQLSTGKRRALKVMHPAMVEDPTLRDRFAQEARVGSLIASDHVVEVVGAGIDTSTGAPWIAMELLEGEDLSSYVARHGPLSPEEMATLFRALCHALGAAHAAGVVHRDIKPENVFMAKTHSTAAPTQVKVLDFGIAKLTAQAHATATATMGTPLWMAPEQSEMGARITPATDVWALGLLAFWALTGRVYWRAAAGPVPSVHTLLREMLFEAIVPASERATEYGMASKLPPGFDAWFSRTVVRDPDARFPDANVALRELLSCSFDKTLSAYPLPAPASAPSHSPVSAPSHAPPSASQQTLAQPTAVQAPQVPTQIPYVSAAPPPQRRSSLGVWIGVFGVLVALVAIAVAGVAIFLMAGQPTTATTSAPAPTTPVTAVPPASEPVVASAAPSASNAPTSRTKIPTTTASASAAPSSSAAAKPPFDAIAASKTVSGQGQTAKFLCKNMDGPAAVTATVSFRNDGSVQNVQMDISARATARGNCTLGTLSGSRVKPFDGPATPIPVAVAF